MIDFLETFLKNSFKRISDFRGNKSMNTPEILLKLF